MGSTVIGGNKEAAIIAINKTGALETSFGTNGIATYDVDLGAGNAEFTGIDYHDEQNKLSEIPHDIPASNNNDDDWKVLKAYIIKYNDFPSYYKRSRVRTFLFAPCRS